MHLTRTVVALSGRSKGRGHRPNGDTNVGEKLTPLSSRPSESSIAGQEKSQGSALPPRSGMRATALPPRVWVEHRRFARPLNADRRARGRHAGCSHMGLVVGVPRGTAGSIGGGLGRGDRPCPAAPSEADRALPLAGRLLSPRLARDHAAEAREVIRGLVEAISLVLEDGRLWIEVLASWVPFCA